MQKQEFSALTFFVFKVLVIIAILCFPIDGNTAANDSADIDLEAPEPATPLVYRSPAERREAGLGTQLTDWLKFSGLLEIEAHHRQYTVVNQGDTNHQDPTATTAQAAFQGKFSDWLTLDLIFETVKDKTLNSHLDEGVFNIDLNDWTIKTGLFYLPFGEYYSHFVTDPMLEFGETRRYALQVDYSITENLEVSLYGFNSGANQDSSSNRMDWGFSMETNTIDESIRLGVSFLSDLAESEGSLLGNHVSNYRHQVQAWSSYILFGFDKGEITLETVQALGEFAELPDIANKPASSNIELAYFINRNLQVALRIAQSSELQSQPAKQYGASVAWRVFSNSTLSADFIHEKFKNNFNFDENGNEIKTIEHVAVQLSVEF